MSKKTTGFSKAKGRKKYVPHPGELQGERRKLPADILRLLVEGMKQRIRASMLFAEKSIQDDGYLCRFSMAANADKTIDAELSVRVSPKISQISEVLGSMRAIKFLPATWVSVGFRYPPAGPEEQGSGIVIGLDGQPRKRKAGKWAYQIQTAYQRATAATRIRGVVGSIIKTCAEKDFRMPYEIFCRVHWNGFGLKPTREG